MKTQERYNNSIIDDVIGDKGIKTDVAITIKPVTIPVIIISVMVAVIGGILIAGFIQKKIK
jgi:hypothetical protein